MSSVKSSSRYSLQPFRRAVLRGLGVILPPLLTIVILIWIANSVQQYVLEPVETFSRHAIVWFMNETQAQIPTGAEVLATVDDGEEPRELVRQDGAFVAANGARYENVTEVEKFTFENEVYVPLSNGQWIPEHVRNTVSSDPGDPAPIIGKDYHHRYVVIQIQKKAIIFKSAFLAGFILTMYLLGKFMAAGVGRFLWHSLEQVITLLPIIRTVYSSVKQVTDFFFNEAEIQFTRVVAVEYPRRGIWSLGFVTGESMATIRAVAEEPVLSVLMPTSPIPGTGFTITVRKSETVDLDIPVDQALQFVVSCGVVLPEAEMREVTDKIAAATADQVITTHES